MGDEVTRLHYLPLKFSSAMTSELQVPSENFLCALHRLLHRSPLGGVALCIVSLNPCHPSKSPIKFPFLLSVELLINPESTLFSCSPFNVKSAY